MPAGGILGLWGSLTGAGMDLADGVGDIGKNITTFLWIGGGLILFGMVLYGFTLFKGIPK